MSDVSAEEDDGLAEDLRTNARHEDRVHAAQLDVDLQAEVGQGLGGRFVDVLGLRRKKSNEIVD